MTNKGCKFPDRLIKEIAEQIDMGMICFLNPDTLELESAMGESYIYGDGEEFNQEIYDKVNKWEKCIRIDPLESYDSFKIMERFIEYCIPDKDRLKERLWNAISGRKPFRQFKFLIDNSQYRQNWFDFKQEELEKAVRAQLEEDIEEATPLIDIDF